MQNLDVDKNAALAEKSLFPARPCIPSLPVTDYVSDDKLTELYGTTAWAGYVQQPAMYLTNAATTTQQNFTGGGIIVAEIDTGVDSTNPILAPSQ